MLFGHFKPLSVVWTRLATKWYSVWKGLLFLLTENFDLLERKMENFTPPPDLNGIVLTLSN